MIAAAVQRIETRSAQRDERGVSKIVNLTVDRARHQASVDGRPLTLAAKEFAGTRRARLHAGVLRHQRRAHEERVMR